MGDSSKGATIGTLGAAFFFFEIILQRKEVKINKLKPGTGNKNWCREDGEVSSSVIPVANPNLSLSFFPYFTSNTLYGLLAVVYHNK